MVALNSLKHVIYQFDMFCSSQLLRYRSETQHKTLAGGLISLAVICVVLGGFASMVGDTLNRVAISSSLVNKKISESPMVKLHPGSENMFMLGFAIHTFETFLPLDLVHGPQYFNIIAKNFEFTNGALTKLTLTKMVQCTREHWKMMPDLAEGYDNFKIDQWLCPPLGASFVLQGSSYASSKYAFLIIQVVACQNSTSNNTCASQAQIDALFAQNKNFFLNFNYINPVINPNQQDFLSYYVEGNDYLLFAPHQVGAENWLLFSDYTITTDESILPYTHITEVTGSIVEQKTIPHPYAATDGMPYAKLILSKSGNSLFFQRENQKISAVFSYIGGLVGAITAVLFLVKSYTDTSLEIAIGFNLFDLEKQQQKENQKEDKGFNLFEFFQLTGYRLLKFFGWKGKLLKAEQLEKFQYEAMKQMDVQLLLKRVIKLETCMSKLFTPQQLKKIREGQAITFKSAKNMRMLLLNRQQANQDEGRSLKEEEAKNDAQMSDAIDDRPSEQEAKQKQRSELESGNSLYKLKPNKYGQFIKPSQLHIEEVKTVTRKAILKRKREGEDCKSEDCHQHGEDIIKHPMAQLSPIII